MDFYYQMNSDATCKLGKQISQELANSIEAYRGVNFYSPGFVNVTLNSQFTFVVIFVVEQCRKFNWTLR